MELVDLFATLTEVCELPSPPYQQGSSLVPLLENLDIKWKKAMFSQLKRTDTTGDTIMGRAVRTKEYHYNSWEDEGEELYNIKVDPYEYTNLAGKPQFESAIKSHAKSA